MPITKTSEITAHELNPRTITDEQLARLKKSLEAYGGWGRLDNVIIDSPHHENKGGCNLYRDPAEEQRNITILKNRWGAIIQDNPKRPNEILLRLPKEVESKIPSKLKAFLSRK